MTMGIYIANIAVFYLGSHEGDVSTLLCLGQICLEFWPACILEDLIL